MKNRRLFYGWTVILSAFAQMFVSSGSNAAAPIFFASVLKDLGWGRASISLAASINTAVVGVAMLVIGGLVDKHGPKTIILAGLPLMGMSTIALSGISQVWHLLLLYALLGLGFACTGLPSVSALVARWFYKKRGLAMGICLTGFALGQLVVVPLSAYMILLFGWRTAYVILGGALLVTTLTMIPVRNDPADMGCHPDGEPSPPKQGVTVDGVSLKDILVTQPFLLMMVVHFLCGFTDIPITPGPCFALFTLDVGLSQMVAATALGLMGGVMSLGTFVMGSASDRFGRKKPLALIYLIRALSLALIMGLSGTTPGLAMLLYAFSVMFGFSYFSMTPVVGAWIGDNYGQLSVGRISGVKSLLHSVGAAVGSQFFGAVYDLHQSYYWGFFTAMVLSLVASLCSLLLRERGALRKDRRP